MKIYLAGPMRGIPEFNFPAFHAAAAKLRAEGHEVFSPAERDSARHGTDISKGNTTGDEDAAAKEHGFDLRTALREDLEWICRHADAVALLPGWERSKGANAERTTATALGLKLIELSDPASVGRGCDDTPLTAVQRAQINAVKTAQARLAKLNEDIASYPHWHWGAALGAMDEERKELKSFLRRHQVT